MKFSNNNNKSTSFLTSISLCVVMLLGIILLFQNCGKQKFAGSTTSTSEGVKDPSGNPVIPKVPDTQAPTARIVSGPEDYEAEATVAIRFEGSDNVGIDSFKCKLDNQAVKLCRNSVTYSALAEGSHIFQLVALDTSGNTSEPVEVAWTVDTRPPIAAFITPYQVTPSALTSAQFHFEGRDVGGSGISGFECKVDNKTPFKCVSPYSLEDISRGAHTFSVRAFDRALNGSQEIDFIWQVDDSGPGDFQILGIRGGSDELVDKWLSDSVGPKVVWGTSTSTVIYNVTILKNDGTAICPTKNTTSTNYTFDDSECVLSEGAAYQARVVANKLTGATTTRFLAFGADFSPPVIEVKPPVLNSADGGATTTLTFKITDLISGVGDAVCYRAYNGATTSYPCLNKTTLPLTNLGIGVHSFYIKATDKVGHEITSPSISWTVKAVVCDPFSPTSDGLCKKGLQGHIYYVNAAERAKGEDYLRSAYADVSSIITKGIKSNTTVFFSQLNYPTVEFTKGFTAGSYVLKDDGGAKLDEWFAFRLDTILKVKASDLAGAASQEYEIAILSDDGSLISVGAAQQVGTASVDASNLIISNDGAHSTKMGCVASNSASRRIKFDINTRLPMRIDYYQGPRTHIALRLIWRKVTASTAMDSLCGSAGSGSEGLGTAAYWNQLVSRGWSDLTPENFMTGETN